MNRKKIFFFVNTLSFFISHRLQIAKMAIKNGYDVKIFYGELGNKHIISSDNIPKVGIKCIKMPLYRNSINPLTEIWTLFYLWKTFISLKPDIIHLVTFKVYLYGGIMARFAKVPCIVSSIAGLGILANYQKKENLIFKIFYSLIFKLGFKHPNQKIIVQNSNDKKILIKNVGINSKKIILIKGSGVDLCKFNYHKDIKNIPNVCFASRLLRTKGVLDFIAAAEILKKRGVKAKFLLAGTIDSQNQSSLTNPEVNEIKNDKIVDVLGYVKNIPKLFSKCQIVCLPSYYGEGMPKVLIEAAASGVAIVTSDIPGCKNTLIPNKTGMLVPIRRPDKLADTLQMLLENPKKLISMGKSGREFAEKNFSIERVIHKHLEIYQNLLKNTY